MLNKSPRFAVNSKSIISSSNPIYFIGSSPIGAFSGNSCIPVFIRVTLSVFISDNIIGFVAEETTVDVDFPTEESITSS